jgi:hypothetical protein
MAALLRPSPSLARSLHHQVRIGTHFVDAPAYFWKPDDGPAWAGLGEGESTQTRRRERQPQ